MVLTFTAHAGEIQLLNDGQDSLHERLKLIDEAQYELLISYFIFAEDESSQIFMAHLRQAVRRKVQIKILIDNMFNKVSKEMMTHLSEEGIEFRLYNKIAWNNFWNLSHRMHDKLLIVDGETVIMGGRNIENSYFGLSEKKRNYYDRDIKIKSSVVANLKNYYLELWDSKHVAKAHLLTLTKKKHIAKIHKARSMLDAIDLNAGAYSPLDSPIEIEDSFINLIHDVVLLKKPIVSGSAKALFDLIDSAQISICIDSPYFILTKEIKTHLKAAIDRGVKIRLLTNSPKATDGLLPLAGYIGQRKKIVTMGVKVYEYFGDDSFHAKSMVVDGKFSMVGSFNFDPRSQKINSETVSIIEDQALAAELEEASNAAIRESYQLDNWGKPAGHNQKYPGVSLKKVIITKLIQYFLVPIGRIHLEPM